MKPVCKICQAWMLKHLQYHDYLKCTSCGYMRKEFIVGITKEELLKGRDKQYPEEYTKEISDNLDVLLIALNKIREVYGKKMSVSSGWRPLAINNVTKGAASHSKHTLGLAADIVDADGSIMKWVLNNLQLMKDLDIYIENFNYTIGWVHFGLGAPSSGHRIFVPSMDKPASTRWDGKYSSEFDN